MAQLGLVGGNLHRDGKKVPIVAADVRLDEGLDLLGASHFEHLMTEGNCASSIVPLPEADATGYRPRMRSDRVSCASSCVQLHAPGLVAARGGSYIGVNRARRPAACLAVLVSVVRPYIEAITA